MTRFAEKTSVSAAKSKAEIEEVLTRYGANKFMYGADEKTATVMFEYKKITIQFTVPLPDKTSKEFTHTPGKGLERDADAAHKAWEQSTRQRWRALCLVIKAKLEAVETGITTFQNEFLAHIVTPTGKTIGETIGAQIETAMKHGRMPKLITMFGKDATKP
jgi:hypothetical protein